LNSTLAFDGIFQGTNRFQPSITWVRYLVLAIHNCQKHSAFVALDKKDYVACG
jgi:hypothetical protein